jgi:hypothetical protein
VLCGELHLWGVLAVKHRPHCLEPQHVLQLLHRAQPWASLQLPLLFWLLAAVVLLLVLLLTGAPPAQAVPSPTPLLVLQLEPT